MPTSDRAARPRRIASVAVPLLVMLCSASCGGAPGRPSTGSTTSTVRTGSTASTTSPPTTSPPGTAAGPGAGPLVLTDADNGRSATVDLGHQVTFTLASTYWTVEPLRRAGVLRAAGQPVTRPHLGSCVAGEGCGTVTATYTAIATGTVTLAASRTVCGEALACPAAQRTFRVLVTVV